jgi:Domain of unknown function (DUF1905)/Bacteriocin-protection, YdeI or OmpD-Associated
MTETRFSTHLGGQSTGPTGIVVPPEHVAALGQGKKPPVQVSVNGYVYASTVAVMGGQFLLPFAAEHRQATGLKSGDKIEVVLTLDSSPRNVAVPEDLATVLGAEGLEAVFVKAAPSRRKEWVRQLTEAKTPDTRARRLAKVLAELRGI